MWFFFIYFMHLLFRCSGLVRVLTNPIKPEKFGFKPISKCQFFRIWLWIGNPKPLPNLKPVKNSGNELCVLCHVKFYKTIDSSIHYPESSSVLCVCIGELSANGGSALTILIYIGEEYRWTSMVVLWLTSVELYHNGIWAIFLQKLMLGFANSNNF